MIPFTSLKLVDQKLRFLITKKLNEILEKSIYIGGEEVAEFESNYAQYLSVDHCISCANGTDAIAIALRALNIGAGDEVLVPAMSWVATSQAVISTGATPVFVDIEKDSPNIDPNLIENHVTERTKAILIVHLFGFPCKMNEITFLAKKHQLPLVEDCAQSHGATYQGKKLGSFGKISCFSFYPTKNLGALGDAGCVVTSDHALAEQCRAIAQMGQKGHHNHVIHGMNSRMDSIQAGVLNIKLPYLNQWNERRRKIALNYQHQLSGYYKIYADQSDQASVFHLFNVQCEERNLLQKHLLDNGIMTQIHYPKALPDLKPNQQYTPNESYPQARLLAQQGLSLPIYHDLKDKEVAYIIKVMNDFASGRRSFKTLSVPL